MIKSEWNTRAFVVTFKLETNEDVLIDKAKKALLKTSCDYVVANILQDRYNKATIVSGYEKIEVYKGEFENIEEILVKEIAILHNTYINKK
jgi:phosphopantothenate-cysteine ligase